MTFSIRFLPEAPFREDGIELRLGQIVIGDFIERFRSPLHLWTEEEYEHQWHQGLERIAAGKTPSCVVTSMEASGDGKQYSLAWYALYLLGEEVAVQEQVVLLDEPTNLYVYVGEYESTVVDDQRTWALSECRVPVDSIRVFFEASK